MLMTVADSANSRSVLAERIIAEREQTGRFKSVGQLREVPGIGEKTFQELAPMVAV
jgi:competence protein ComEA